MKRFGFLLFAWCLLASLLAARSEAAPVCQQVKYSALSLAQNDGVPVGGIGGTGRSASETGGIGGTGRSASETGGVGGTGIVGTITGFASICVNGLEVHYESDVPVSENGRPADIRQLAVGQIVTVEAVDSPRGLEARRVGIVHALEGPVTYAAAGSLEVMGAPVLTSELAGSAKPRLRKGDWVQVSGHADAQGRILASRIVRIPARAEATVVGDAQPASRRVGAVLIDQRQVGEVMAHGRWDGYRLRVREVQPAPDRDWRSHPDRIVVETRVLEIEGGRVRSGRPEVDDLLGEQGGNLKPGDIVRVSARRDSAGRLSPEKVERAERAERRGRGPAERPEKAVPGKRIEPGERHDRSRRGGREDGNVRSVRHERPEKAERSDRRERPERHRRDR